VPQLLQQTFSGLMYSLSEIATITHSEFRGISDHKITTFLCDSRNLISPSGVLFIALKTGKNNGHNYIQDLIEKGVQAFLVQQGEFDPASVKDKNISFIVSADPLKSLQQLAKHHRSQFKIPVIGITGSNGKTMVKEWLYQLLKNDFSICRSPRSFNSQIGVPLSILNLNFTHSLGIFEAGISEPGEMQILADIIQPETGILTSLGSAHDEGFESREQKLSEKLKLFSGCKKVIANSLEKKNVPGTLQERCLIVSENGDADYNIKFSENSISLKHADQKLDFKIPFSDRASALNISTCIALMLQMDYAAEEISRRVQQLQPIALRLEIKSGIGNSLVINDYYNSDLDSLKIALNFLQQQNRRMKKTVIISDIEQSGMPVNALYREIADLVQSHKIEQIIGIGKKISSFKTLFKSGSLFFESTEEFIRQFPNFSYRLNDSAILLKGARSYGFENIGRLLQQKSHDTVFEINLNRLASNISYYRMLLKPKVKLMCMVKAMGYGGGSSELAKSLQHLGVDYLAVAYADEGVELRQSQIHLPVMVMSPESDALSDIINYRLEPEIYSFGILEQFILRLDQLSISEPYPVHIKIDTGMKRLGFEDKNIPQLINVLKSNPQIKVQSVFSHLAGSDSSNFDEFTQQQIKLFGQASAGIEKGIGYAFIKHICNSGGITRFPQAHFDMARLGIGMHGIGVNEEEQKKLENVGSLKTRVSQIKKVKAGETIGYNRSGKAEKDITIAIIPIGYADGFSRMLGNGKFGVYINGNYCKTIGNICMDMCMIDVSQIICGEGDEVIVFENTSQLKEMARAMETISYEVLTSVSGRVKRIYVQE
jgi:alanine racemase